jgi:hypothetical protein
MASSGQPYTFLAGGVGDYMRGLSTIHQLKENWKFKNNLPMDIYLFIQKKNTDHVTYAGKVSGRGELSFKHTLLSPGDIVHTYWYYKKGPSPARPSMNYEDIQRIMPEYTLTGFAKTINLGGVDYNTLMGNGEFKSSSKDISGIRMYNRMFIPMRIYHKGDLVGEMKMNDGMTILGGTQSGFLYRGRYWNGINLGYEFTFTTTDDKELFTATISDVNCLEMFIGVVTAGYMDPRQGYADRYVVP